MSVSVCLSVCLSLSLSLCLSLSPPLSPPPLSLFPLSLSLFCLPVYLCRLSLSISPSPSTPPLSLLPISSYSSFSFALFLSIPPYLTAPPTAPPPPFLHSLPLRPPATALLSSQPHCLVVFSSLPSLTTVLFDGGCGGCCHFLVLFIIAIWFFFSFGVSLLHYFFSGDFG